MWLLKEKKYRFLATLINLIVGDSAGLLCRSQTTPGVFHSFSCLYPCKKDIDKAKHVCGSTQNGDATKKTCQWKWVYLSYFGYILFHFVLIPHFVYPDGHLGCFHFLVLCY